jgi:hypothetical protein
MPQIGPSSGFSAKYFAPAVKLTICGPIFVTLP